MTISTAVPPSAVARTLGIETIFKDRRAGGLLLLPQRLAIVAQGSSSVSYSTDKFTALSARQVGETLGFGSPAHLAAKELLPANGDGIGTIPLTIYPLEDDPSGVQQLVEVTPTGAATTAGPVRIIVNGTPSETILVPVGMTIADFCAAATQAVNAVLDIPVTAINGSTLVVLGSKWAGSSSTAIAGNVVVEDPSGVGFVFGVVASTPGSTNPDVDDALNQVGDVWETMFLNAMESTDTSTLDKFSTFGEGRWGALTRKPMVAINGTTESDLATAIAVPSARQTDRTNVQIPFPGSVELPFVAAARALARMAVVADSNPPVDYASQDVDGIIPGADDVQWDYLTRNTAVTNGSSTTELKDGVINLSDTITYYRPDGENPPAYRYVNDIVKLQNILFNIDVVFNTPEWDGAPLIPDDQPTVNRAAKKPRTFKAAIASIIDGLALNAIISDPETAKANVQVEIDANNPRRVNAVIPVQLSGNVSIISIDLEFGFFFGTPTVVA